MRADGGGGHRRRSSCPRGGATAFARRDARARKRCAPEPVRTASPEVPARTSPEPPRIALTVPMSTDPPLVPPAGPGGRARPLRTAGAGPHPGPGSGGLRLRRQFLPAAARGGGARRLGGGGAAALRAEPRPGHPPHLPRCRNQPLRPVAVRRAPGGGGAALAVAPGRGRRAPHPGPAGDDRRPPERAAPALRTEDRSRPGEHPRLHPGRHPGQQQQRDVLRRRAEQLPHPPLADLRAALRHPHRHRRRGRRHAAPGARAGAPPGPAHAPRRGALAARRWWSASGRSTG